MSKFRAILQGNFNSITVNKRLRELHERIEMLEDIICEQPVLHEEAETATSNSAELVTIEAPAVRQKAKDKTASTKGA